MRFIKQFLPHFHNRPLYKESISPIPLPEEYAELLRTQSQPSLAELFFANKPINSLVTYCMQDELLGALIKEQVKLLLLDEQIAQSNLQELWMEGFPKSVIKLSQLSAQEIIDLESTGWRFVIKHFPDLTKPAVSFRFKYCFQEDGRFAFHDYYEEIELDSELGQQLLGLRPWHQWIHRVWEVDDEGLGSERTIIPPANELSLFSKSNEES